MSKTPEEKFALLVKLLGDSTFCLTFEQIQLLTTPQADAIIRLFLPGYLDG